ncbi:hypothetical protein J7384_18570 [Endozoicomonas sp. G2_1]|uniref:hypothetical protein n=1 Tax=Endozoicomonas sp. G2_1 TaxID=2821091 RepID=UPI001ADA98D4|nr:hypothetical protein [Endozoicomonas sp. G2_1]MBO9492373.1 hypothetical protein [Endozoicomonas sp. G2_1]
MEGLQQIEVSIFNWFIQNCSEYAFEFKKQLSLAVVTEREFTNGGGVFVSFAIPVECKNNILKKNDYLEGPLIKSSQLESGALVTVNISKDGLVEHFEIFSLAGDYPKSQHVVNYELSLPTFQTIDIR